MNMTEKDIATARKHLTALVVERGNEHMTSPNTLVGQRLFRTVKMDDGRYLAHEFLPTGAIIEGETNDGEMIVDHDRREEIKAAYVDNPNGFRTWLEERNLNPDDVPLHGGGFSVNRIEHPSLDNAVDAILSAVQANKLLPQYTPAS